MANDDWHVIPNDDLREHDSYSTCWCKPVEVEPGLWSHNSLDGRELIETGKRMIN